MSFNDDLVSQAICDVKSSEINKRVGDSNLIVTSIRIEKKDIREAREKGINLSFLFRKALKKELLK